MCAVPNAVLGFSSTLTTNISEAHLFYIFGYCIQKLHFFVLMSTGSLKHQTIIDFTLCNSLKKQTHTYFSMMSFFVHYRP